MKWQAYGTCAINSHADDCDGRNHKPECGRFTINRAPAPGFPAPRGINYMLTERDNGPYKARILHVERGVADTLEATLAATRMCKAKAAERAK